MVAGCTHIPSDSPSRTDADSQKSLQAYVEAAQTKIKLLECKLQRLESYAATRGTELQKERAASQRVYPSSQRAHDLAALKQILSREIESLTAQIKVLETSLATPY
jgi:prefoldin subunit 5